MYESLIGTTIDKMNQDYADFPDFLDGYTFLGYDNGFIAEDNRQETINKNARAYLENTDWYVTRFIETGVQIPDEITQKRAEARGKIV